MLGVRCGIQHHQNKPLEAVRGARFDNIPADAPTSPGGIGKEQERMARLIDEATGEVLDPRTSPDLYTLDSIRHADIWTPQAIREEYSRLRKIANERLKVLAKYEEGRQSLTYKRNLGKYKPAKELTLGETKVLLADVSRMISAKRGTLTGIRQANKKAIETLHERGYDFVTKKNIRAFGEFMEYWRNSDMRSYGSLLAADSFEAAIKNRISPEQIKERFETWKASQTFTGETRGEALLDSWGDFLDDS